MDQIKFFKSQKEFHHWLKKNYLKSQGLWLGFYKKGTQKKLFNMSEAMTEALIFGWSCTVIKKLDELSYKAKYSPRKYKSSWSLNSINKFKKLKKQGLATDHAIQIFNNRDKKNSEEKSPAFSPSQLKIFKKNKKAWEFFKNQTPSYQKYTTFWVIIAKRQETKQKRLQMLIEDSANGSKLKRILAAQEKIKKQFEPGKTPIEHAKNIGAVAAAELKSIGITTLEQLKNEGWEESFRRLCEAYPNRINMNMLSALIGACEDQHWNNLDNHLKSQAKSVLAELKTFKYI